MASGDLTDAATRAERLRELLAREPDDAATHFALGRALLELSRWDEAVTAFRRATGIDPRYTAAHRDLGRALLEAGEVEEAARVLGDALALADETGDLQTGREMRVFLGRAEKLLGREPTQRAARPEPAPAAEPRAEDPRAKALYREGFAHFANDRFDEAIALYRQALEIDPELAIAWNGLSLAHRGKGDLDAAIEAGKRLIELEPDDALSHTNLSILYMRNGLIPEAEEEKAIAMQLQLRQAGSR